MEDSEETQEKSSQQNEDSQDSQDDMQDAIVIFHINIYVFLSFLNKNFFFFF